MNVSRFLWDTRYKYVYLAVFYGAEQKLQCLPIFGRLRDLLRLKVVKYPKLAEDAIFGPVTLIHSFHFSETLSKCEGNGSDCNLNISVPYNILVHVPRGVSRAKKSLLGQFLSKILHVYLFCNSLRCLAQMCISGCLKFLCFHIFPMVHGPTEINVVNV